MRMSNTEQTAQLYQLTKDFLIETKDYPIEIHKLLIQYRSKSSLLYPIYNAILNDKYYQDEQTKIDYVTMDDFTTIRQDSFYFKINKQLLLRAIQVFVDMLMPCFALGTVVDMKKEYLKQIKNIDDTQNVRFVVMQRFIMHKDVPTYLHFGGLVYPFGMLEDRRMFYFTSELVESVVHEGFKDELELAYELEMKKELILDKGYKSIAFASEEERNTFQAFLQGRR